MWENEEDLKCTIKLTEMNLSAYSGTLCNCNSLLFGLPAYQLHRVQQVLNAAARMIFGGKKQDSITPLLVKLHWLGVVERVRFKICLTVYKSLNGSSPEYISEFLKPVTDLHRRSTLRSATHDHLLVPMITSEFGKRSFAFAGPSCWNQLPDHVSRHLLTPSNGAWKRIFLNCLTVHSINYRADLIHRFYYPEWWLCKEPLLSV